MRKLTLHIHNDREAFIEHYVEGERGSFTKFDIDLDGWAHALIQRYNDTLRPGERARTLDRVEVETLNVPSAKREHAWEKTNLTTIEYRGRFYDTAKCTGCGVTGKRYGVSEVARDAKFRAKKYRFCNP
jgi:hypothetical protein